MRRVVFLLATVLAAFGMAATTAASPPATGVVRNYADLTADCPNPEGIAIDPNGNVYASSAPHIFSGSGPANICIISEVPVRGRPELDCRLPGLGPAAVHPLLSRLRSLSQHHILPVRTTE